MEGELDEAIAAVSQMLATVNSAEQRERAGQELLRRLEGRDRP